MEVNQLVAHYKANYERKVFMTRLSHAMQNAYLMYIYDYPSELKNFADTFLAYLPFYIRNSDYFETVEISPAKDKLKILKRPDGIKPYERNRVYFVVQLHGIVHTADRIAPLLGTGFF